MVGGGGEEWRRRSRVRYLFLCAPLRPTILKFLTAEERLGLV